MSYDMKQKQEKFTPGKWTTKEWMNGKKRNFFIEDKNRETICDIYESDEYPERAEANAALIAAAPGTYYTLKNFVLDLRSLRYVKNEFEFNRKLLEMISTAESTLKNARGDK